MSEARDLAVIEAHLRPEEKVLFSVDWNRAVAMKNYTIAVFFFGFVAFDFYRDYSAFNSLEAACGDLAYYKCGKFYSVAWWLVPLSAAMTALGLYIFLASTFGLHRQVYAISDQRALQVRLGFPRGFDAFELAGTTFQQISGGLEIRKGRLKMIWQLDRNAAQKASNCLEGLIGSPKP